MGLRQTFRGSAPAASRPRRRRCMCGRGSRRNRLKQFRALATRYTKRAADYRTTLAAIVLWLRESPDTT